MITLLRLLLAHAVADFLLQTATMARSKMSPKWLGAHAGIHAAAYVVVLIPRPWPEIVAISLGLFVVHATIDWCKAAIGSGSAFAFALDQVAHLVTLVAAASLAPTAPFPAADVLGPIVASPRWTLLATVYVTAIFGGNYFVQAVVAPFRAAGAVGDRRGEIVGWFERFVFVTLLASDHAGAVALLVVAKTIVRYPELMGESRRAAGVYLIGALASLAVAVAGAAVLRAF